MSETRQAARSYWAATAAPAPALPQLRVDVETDVAIVGGGFSGLTTAHYLARAGIGSIVLEANEPGWAASGRNAGMAVLRYKSGWAALAREHGEDVARHMFRALHAAMDALEATVAHYRIDCRFQRCGHVTAAHGAAPLSALEADARWLEREMGYEAASILSRAEITRLTGIHEYVGGFLDRRSGALHPLAYARGLAAGVAAHTPVFARTPVSGYRRDGAGFVLDTPHAKVRARRVVFATNADTGLYRLPNDLARRIVPVPSNIVVTAPLPEPVARELLPEGQVVTDARRINLYFRRTPDRRMLFGTRGHLSGSGEPWAYAEVEAAMRRLFPSLADAPIEFRWNGRIDISLDYFPHVGQCEPGVYYALGFSGRGVVLTHMAARLLAAMLAGANVDLGPITGSRFAPVALHGLHPLGIRLFTAYYRLLDAREERARTPPPRR